jgi:hypothetical protein
MKPDAVHQAYERLERAKAAVAVLTDESRTIGEFNVAWSNFIMAANTVYSKLEQGAKGIRRANTGTEGKSTLAGGIHFCITYIMPETAMNIRLSESLGLVCQGNHFARESRSVLMRAGRV